jgi:oligoendopeptidase F
MQQQFGVIAGKMTVEIKVRNSPCNKLPNSWRTRTETLGKKCTGRSAKGDCRIKAALNELFTALLQKDQQVALNAGFENFRDYRFLELGRFDYSKEDCFQFHEAVKTTCYATGQPAL